MIKKIIKQNIFILIIGIILITVIWIVLYKAINKPRESEVFDFFITGVYVDKEYFKDITNNSIKVKVVSVDSCDENNSYYQVLLQTQGIITGDILIVEKDLFNKPGATSSFTILTNELFDKNDINQDSFEFITISGNRYGIVVKSSDFDLFDGKVKYYDNNKEYVIAINKSSTKQEMATLVLINLLKKDESDN